MYRRAAVYGKEQKANGKRKAQCAATFFRTVDAFFAQAEFLSFVDFFSAGKKAKTQRLYFWKSRLNRSKDIQSREKRKKAAEKGLDHDGRYDPKNTSFMLSPRLQAFYLHMQMR